MKLGLFTDTLEDINGVARFIRDIGERASEAGCDLTVHTSVAKPTIVDAPFVRKNFDPLITAKLPYYPQLSVSLPPAWALLNWAEEQKFDVVHCSTPGPVGLCGWLIARWLRIPLAATYHTNFPAYVQRLSGSKFLAGGTGVFMKMFYRPAAMVFARSREYHEILVNLGIERRKLRTIRPAINLERFNPSYRDPSVFDEFKVKEPLNLLYIGRVSVEKQLELLVESYKRICAKRRDIALIIAGEGPYRERMIEALAGLPIYFLGVQPDRVLARLYASADLFAFPSRTDTLGQVVMEAQACGLPVLVSDEGGPQTIIESEKSGRVVHGIDPAHWAAEIERLIDDRAIRAAMSQHAAERLTRYSLTDTFADFWAQHETISAAQPHRPHAAAAEEDASKVPAFV